MVLYFPLTYSTPVSNVIEKKIKSFLVTLILHHAFFLYEEFFSLSNNFLKMDAMNESLPLIYYHKIDGASHGT